MSFHDQEFKKSTLKLVLQELKEDPYHKFKLVFALMGVIPILTFVYVIFRLFPRSIFIFGKISFILLALISISFLAFLLGYEMIKKLLDKIVFFIFELRRSEQLKADLVASVSHDFEIPIKILKEQVSGLTSGAHGALNETQASRLNSCQGTLDNMNHTIKTLLDLYKIEAGLVVLQKEPCDLEKLIEDKVNEFSNSFNKRKIRVSRDIKSKPGLIKVDINKMKEVVNNIFSNFMKYTPEGGWVKWGIYSSSGFLRIELSNNSEAIPAGQLGVIFDKFKKLYNEKEGSGLGLSIAKSIIEVHGGEIWVENIPAKGVQFVIVLPCV